MSKRFTFVILHYMAIEMTITCVKYIRNNLPNKNVNIVIVDNGSTNTNEMNLKEYFSQFTNTYYIRSEENVGFAKGNNIGYHYAKENLSPDYIIMLNNDVLIEDVQFLDKVLNVYSKKRFAVLGPDIWAINKNEHQSPMQHLEYTLDDIIRIINQRKKWLAIYPFHYLKDCIIEEIRKNTFYKRIRGKIRPLPFKENLEYKVYRENCILHGSCLVFSEVFIEKRINAFNPETFLYFEEDILYFECMQQGLKIVYEPLLQVKHLEDVSTNYIWKTRYKKEKMKYTYLIKSGEVLRNVICNIQKKDC